MRDSIPVFLQMDLCEELKSLFAGQTFFAPAQKTEGQEPQKKELNVFRQWLPVPHTAEAGELTPELVEQGRTVTETAEQVFPYIVVRISEGKTEQPEGQQKVNMVLNFGTYDPAADNSGYMDILHMIATIQWRFFRNPLLNHRYECDTEMEWALQDEESYPYNFGSLSMNFSTAQIAREDGYA